MHFLVLQSLLYPYTCNIIDYACFHYVVDHAPRPLTSLKQQHRYYTPTREQLIYGGGSFRDYQAKKVIISTPQKLSARHFFGEGCLIHVVNQNHGLYTLIFNQ